MIFAWCAAVAQVPQIVDPVTELTDVLSDAQEAELDRKVRAIRDATGVQIAVLTVGTVGYGETIEAYSLQVAQQWGGGGGERDDGLLVVLAVWDHRSRIEVGYGLEGYVTDAEAGALLDAAVPALRAEDYAGALNGIVDGLGSEVESLRAGEDVPMMRRAVGSVLRWIPEGNTMAGVQAGLGAFLSLLVLLAWVRAEPRGLTRLFPPVWLVAAGASAVWLAQGVILFNLAASGFIVQWLGGSFAGLCCVSPLPWSQTGFKFTLGAVWSAFAIAVTAYAAGHAGDEAFQVWMMLAMIGTFITAALCLEHGEGGGGSSGSSDSSSSSWSSGSSSSSSSSSSGGDWGGGGGGFGGGGASGSW
ncbi:MAG: TPM domain-containing protein [Myxococcota bacterium]